MIPVQRLIQRNYTATRKGYTIKRVVLHTYGGKGTSLYNWFNRIPVAPDKGSSAHYAVMKDGKVEQYVKDTDIAWHAGTTHTTAKPNNNYESIGIEHQDDGNSGDSVRTPELYESASQLVAMLCKKYSIPCVLLPKTDAWGRGITLHNYYTTAKPCPAGLDSNRIVNRAREILNVNSNPMPTVDYSTPNTVTLQVNNTYDNVLPYIRPDVVKLVPRANYGSWSYSYGGYELSEMALSYKRDLEKKSAELSATQKELSTTQSDLTKANDKIKELNGNVKALESSLQENKTQYEKDKEELEIQVAREENKNKLLKEQNDALTISNNNQSVLIEKYETKIENQRKIIVRLEEKLANCETSMGNAIQTLIKKISDFIINLLPKKK